MDGITYAEAFIGLVLGSGIMWAPIFAFAYATRKFGGTARNYSLAFVATWFARVIFFVAMTLLENHGAG